jgi:hypothetical protein
VYKLKAEIQSGKRDVSDITHSLTLTIQERVKRQRELVALTTQLTRNWCCLLS